MNFTAKDVADLRALTGCGMMDCKKALTEAEGDVEKATEILTRRVLQLPLRRQAVLQLRVLHTLWSASAVRLAL